MMPRSSRWRWVWFAALTLSGTVSGMYCPEAGRFLQQDPVGYVDGLNLYGYASCSPVKNLDAMGKWNSDVHDQWTSLWAVKTGMKEWAAYHVGTSDDLIDTIYPPLTNDNDLSWHFNMNFTDDFAWNDRDTRWCHTEDEYAESISICRRGGDDPKQVATEALTHLGWGLHPAQDWVAHGTWYPKPTGNHVWPEHPNGSDTWGMDFKHYAEISDGILRDWEHFHGDPGPFSNHFEPGPLREYRTENISNYYLNRFKHDVKKTICWCVIYGN
jgi:hypothetical protein